MLRTCVQGLLRQPLKVGHYSSQRHTLPTVDTCRQKIDLIIQRDAYHQKSGIPADQNPIPTSGWVANCPTDYVVDLRSDTITQPSAEMRTAMAEAPVGDDVFGEDPTVNDLQDRMADMFGMEASLFVPTGTMGNLISVLSHCDSRGLEVLLGDRSHIYLYEQGGIAQLGGVHPRSVRNNPDGTFDLDEVDLYVRPQNDPHQPFTSLICVENTHNYCGGKVVPLEFLRELREKADRHGLKIHMDGARLMNAAVALNVDPSDIVADMDSVSLCFSKGLGAPIGSIVGGSKDFINKCIRLRKVLGGGMRQAGIIAAAANVGLDDARERLKKDHENAKKIARELLEDSCGVVDIDVDGIHTNIIMMNILKDELEAADVCDRLNKVTEQEFKDVGKRTRVQCMAFSSKKVRMVTHSSMNPDDIAEAVAKVKYVLKEWEWLM